ncbi:hypothetical protein AMECASPLE_019872 [Ameca splendens]|uniref:Uncharacterized protein n=1 Tax=Ameca splendens TaxID=208324 RepID=A0ABV0XS64_9TELE
MYQKAVEMVLLFGVSGKVSVEQICGAVGNVMVLVGVCAQRAGPRSAHLMGQLEGRRRGEVTDVTDRGISYSNGLSVTRHSAVEMHAYMPCVKHTYSHQTHTYRYHFRGNILV